MGSCEIVYNSIMLAMDREEVVAAFAGLFKLAPEKAASILARPGTVLRSNLDVETAEMYREKLIAIGLVVEVRHKPRQQTTAFRAGDPVAPGLAEVAPQSLALEPIDQLPDAAGDDMARYRGNQSVTFVFSGSALAYFRIWIVNVLLTLLTFGIYSAWATVRTRQYFHSQTTLLEAPFRFVGTAQQLITMRFCIIVAVTGALLCGLLPPAAGAMLFCALALVVPVMLVQVLHWRRHFIAWRDTGFSFSRDFAGAYAVLLPPLLLLSVMPLAAWFYGDSSAAVQSGISTGVLLLLCVGWPYWHCTIDRFLVSRSCFGKESFVVPATGVASYYAFYFFRAPLMLLLVGVLPGLLAMLGVGRELVSQWQEMQVLLEQSRSGMPDWVALQDTAASSAGVMLLVFTLLSLLAYVWFFAWARASLFNLRYNGVALRGSVLSCEMRAWPLFWLYVVNTLVILLSNGLLIPWAMVRTVRYRLSCLTVYASYELEDVIAEARR